MYTIHTQPQPVLVPGSLLKAKKSVGLPLDHSGIFAGSQKGGTPIVLHSRQRGVVWTTFEEFSLGREVQIVDVPATLEHQRVVLQRAWSQIGHPFDLLIANCEHFASWAFYGEAESPQLKKYVGAAILGGLALWGLSGLDPGTA